MSEPEQGTGPVDSARTSVGAVPVAPSAPRADDVLVTGDDAVDEALRRLTDVGGQDLRTQVATFEDVHGALQDRLADAEG